ncbi:hypothetical protein BJ742DRAFT_887734 [Cladochytrium replicatum]|nr:hypothetical protein BJ742DRAFT_887734 [Cladochytrium replicatum]
MEFSDISQKISSLRRKIQEIESTHEHIFEQVEPRWFTQQTTAAGPKIRHKFYRKCIRTFAWVIQDSARNNYRSFCFRIPPTPGKQRSDGGPKSYLKPLKRKNFLKRQSRARSGTSMKEQSIDNPPQPAKRPTSPLRPPNFYNVRLSNAPVFLRRTTIRPPDLHMDTPGPKDVHRTPYPHRRSESWERERRHSESRERERRINPPTPVPILRTPIRMETGRDEGTQTHPMLQSQGTQISPICYEDEVKEDPPIFEQKSIVVKDEGVQMSPPPLKISREKSIQSTVDWKSRGVQHEGAMKVYEIVEKYYGLLDNPEWKDREVLICVLPEETANESKVKDVIPPPNEKPATVTVGFVGINTDPSKEQDGVKKPDPLFLSFTELIFDQMVSNLFVEVVREVYREAQAEETLARIRRESLEAEFARKRTEEMFARDVARQQESEAERKRLLEELGKLRETHEKRLHHDVHVARKEKELALKQLGELTDRIARLDQERAQMHETLENVLKEQKEARTLQWESMRAQMEIEAGKTRLLLEQEYRWRLTQHDALRVAAQKRMLRTTVATTNTDAPSPPPSPPPAPLPAVSQRTQTPSKMSSRSLLRSSESEITLSSILSEGELSGLINTVLSEGEIVDFAQFENSARELGELRGSIRFEKTLFVLSLLISIQRGRSSPSAFALSEC